MKKIIKKGSKDTTERGAKRNRKGWEYGRIKKGIKGGIIKEEEGEKRNKEG